MMRLLSVALCCLVATAVAQKAPLCPTTDAILIIDSSQSITNEQFSLIKTYAGNFVSTFNVGSGNDQAQFAGIIFNEDVQVQWNLNDYTTQQDLQAYIAQLPYITGTTNTGNAFTTAGNLLTGQGARQTSCKGIILFTDGRYDSGDNPIPLAEQLRDQLGATVLSVAVDGINGFLSPYDYNMLVQLSGDPNLVFVMPSSAEQAEVTKVQMKTALLNGGVQQ